MHQTGYLPLRALGKLSPNFVGGFCKLWYTPIENISQFPAIDPTNQLLRAEPVLKASKTWYGPLTIPDDKRGWKQKLQRGRPGIWYSQQVTGMVPGNNSANHINLQNLAYHQLCVVGKLRAGGFHIILGNAETGMDVTSETASGGESFDSPGTSLTLDWAGDALILPSFAGINSEVAPSAGNVIVTPPVPSNPVGTLTYTATGLEGTTINFPQLAGKTILLFALESVLLDVIFTTPGPRVREVLVIGTAYTFATPVKKDMSIKILYK
jgi:hypothetical protein